MSTKEASPAKTKGDPEQARPKIADDLLLVSLGAKALGDLDNRYSFTDDGILTATIDNDSFENLQAVIESTK